MMLLCLYFYHMFCVPSRAAADDGDEMREYDS